METTPNSDLERRERRAIVAFWSLRGVGPVTLSALRTRFGSLASALESAAEARSHLRPDARADFDLNPDLDGRAAGVEARSAELGARILFRSDPEWPAPLSDLGTACPECLFVRGTLGAKRRIALVGTRRTDTYGERAAFQLGRRLAAAGLTVVSGGAEGIDTRAHLGALEAGGSTWAVLGGGFDHLYPRSNVELFERVVKEGGALITEHAPSHEVKEGNFPRRNKVVAAVSEAVVVVRGAADSGAMITARDAHLLKRSLLAVPGQVGDQLSDGPNRLLRSGWARACGEAEDVLRALGLAAPLEDVATPAELNPPAAPRPAAPTEPLEPELQPILQALSTQPLHFDDLLGAARVSAPALAAALTRLELKGLAQQRPGKFFLRT